MIIDAANFKDEEEGRRYIFDNVLKNHDTLFHWNSRGWNNMTAYAAEKIRIEDKMPILIAEKIKFLILQWATHAIHGAKTSRVYNPKRKRNRCKDNSCSRKEKEDPSAAYFQCHTDITVPYEELEEISVVTKRRETHYTN